MSDFNVNNNGNNVNGSNGQNNSFEQGQQVDSGQKNSVFNALNNQKLSETKSGDIKFANSDNPSNDTYNGKTEASVKGKFSISELIQKIMNKLFKGKNTPQTPTTPPNNPVEQPVVKYGIPEQPVIKYGIPEEPVIKYGIPEEPKDIKNDNPPEGPVIKYGIPDIGSK